MREYVGIPARKTCNLQTFAFLIVDLGAGGPGIQSPPLALRALGFPIKSRNAGRLGDRDERRLRP